MREGKLRRIFFVGIFVAVLLLTAACTDGLALTPSSIRQAHSLPVDTTFKEFYQTLGGIELLGPAISPLELRDNLQCQYTERVLLCLNPAATGAGRFRLFPLGLALNIQEDTHNSAVSSSTKSRLVDG
ncbi:MAG: hypothetical protein IH586_00400, partial [Anaerolineaceae bacterium]|nr:hypothetical protein [Anaerolineaceae bacterium]